MKITTHQQVMMAQQFTTGNNGNATLKYLFAACRIPRGGLIRRNKFMPREAGWPSEIA